MVWSGIMIYWANDIYSVSWGDTTILQFFPDSFYKALHLNHRLAEALSLHFMFMWLFMLNGLLYVIYTIFSGTWRELIPGRKSFHEAWLVLLKDLRIRKSDLPERKYNGAQQIVYTGVILMGMGSALTGIAIYKPIQFSWLCAMFGGYAFSRMIHFILTIGYVVFFLIHIAQVARSGWNNFRSMIAGFEIQDKKKNAKE